MSLIKPRTRGKQLVRHITRLDHESNETLFAYAAFIGESTEYVLNQLIDAALAKDREFVQWRIEHPESFVGRPSMHRRSARSRRMSVASATPSAGASRAAATGESHA